MLGTEVLVKTLSYVRVLNLFLVQVASEDYVAHHVGDSNHGALLPARPMVGTPSRSEATGEPRRSARSIPSQMHAPPELLTLRSSEWGPFASENGFWQISMPMLRIWRCPQVLFPCAPLWQQQQDENNGCNEASGVGAEGRMQVPLPLHDRAACAVPAFAANSSWLIKAGL